MSETKKQGRYGAIELVRCIGAVAVILFHFGGFYLESRGAFSQSYLFVEFFFLVSGFFMLRHVDQKPEPLPTWRFLLRKVRGFYAPLCITSCVHLLINCFIQRFETISQVAQSLFHFKWEFLLLNTAGFIQGPQFGRDYLMGQVWYLSAMILALVIAYPLAKYYRRAFISIICPLSLIGIYSYFIQTYGDLNVGNGYAGFLTDAVLRGFAGTCAGCLTYEAYKLLSLHGLDDPKHRSLAKLAEAAAWVLLLLAFVFGSYLDAQPGAFLVLVFAAIVLFACLDMTPISRVLNTRCPRLLGWLGKYSLYIYLSHWTVLMAMRNFLPRLEGLLAGACILGGSLVYGYVLMQFDSRRRSTTPVVVICLVLILACFVTPVFF